MTSPALVVLCAALVCSILGTALEEADYDTTKDSVLNSILRNHGEIHKHTMTPTAYMDSQPHKTARENEKTKATDVNSRTSLNFEKHSTKDRNLDATEDPIYFEANDDIVKKTAGEFPTSKFDKDIHDFGVNKDHNRIYNHLKAEYVNFKPKKVSDRVKRQTQEETCDPLTRYGEKITHPHLPGQQTYSSNTDCIRVIKGKEGQVVKLTFVDIFHIEDHPECKYDYLEIRDGLHGYARSLGKLCGQIFPEVIYSTGPDVWIKFHSDDTIEYEGFQILVEYVPNSASHKIPESCYITLDDSNGELYDGVVDSSSVKEDCRREGPLDVLWNITVKENYKIYLNFTNYSPSKPNECEENVVEVFGHVLEADARLAQYCGSIANPVMTKVDETNGKDKGNNMFVRLFLAQAFSKFQFNATFTRFRTLDSKNTRENSECDPSTEFTCGDNTCVHANLRCNQYANCRLKTDEDPELCMIIEKSIVSQPHILVILVIFSLILAGMNFVFLFKCIRKLYQDHNIIKEHIRQSCEDRLDHLMGGQLDRLVGLSADALGRESQPRASLERENRANEMYKKKFSQKQHSIESDIQDTQIDLDIEPGRHYLEHSPIQEEVQIERNGRVRRSDFSGREESARSRTKERSLKEKRMEKMEDKRDVSVAAPDTKESGCQTRESLFQDGAPSSNGSGSASASVGFSTFGYSGATIARPSPPPPQPAATSEITIELLRSVPAQDGHSKKLPDRRPMSNETTRSAPDVIIVSKPIR